MIIRKIESIAERRVKRVAAYARVSTEAERQKESLRTQIDYYTAFIRQNQMWEYVKVYADPGKSGASARHRPQFRQMIADAKAGKLDVILVKSVSRFARNVADAQRYVHELKSYDVEVFFEREAISSFDPSSDMVFSVLSAVAQEESRSISENIKWSYRKHAEKGIRRLGSNRILGYDEVNGVLTPNKDAWIVKRLFELYASGLQLGQVATALMREGAHTLRQKSAITAKTVYCMLRNEIYVGDRIIQKRAPANYLTKRPDLTVAYDSYHITDDHEGIITRELWNKAQAIIAQR